MNRSGMKRTVRPVPVVLEGLETRRLFAAAAFTINTVSNASEAGPTAGIFQISRTSTNRSSPLTVQLRLSGSATDGSDYTLSELAEDHQVTVTIPIDETSTLLRVTPIDDAVVEPAETVVVTAVLSDTTITPPQASMTISDNDSGGTTPEQPVAHAGGPYRVTEGRSETLHGTATASSGRTVQAYQWDFNYDGVTFNVDATGASPRFSAVGIDGQRGGTVRTIGFRVIDSASAVSDVSTSLVTILNAAPTAIFRGGNVRLGQAGVVSFTNITDVPADVAAGFTYRFDFNNDGVIDLATHRSSATVPASYLRTAGPHTIRATITDKDGGVGTYTTTVTLIRTTSPGPAAVRSLDRLSLAELA